MTAFTRACLAVCGAQDAWVARHAFITLHHAAPHLVPTPLPLSAAAAAPTAAAASSDPVSPELHQAMLAAAVRLLVGHPAASMAPNWPSAAEAAVAAVYALSPNPQEVLAAVVEEMFRRCRPTGEVGTGKGVPTGPCCLCVCGCLHCLKCTKSDMKSLRASTQCLAWLSHEHTIPVSLEHFGAAVAAHRPQVAAKHQSRPCQGSLQQHCPASSLCWAGRPCSTCCASSPWARQSGRRAWLRAEPLPKPQTGRARPQQQQEQRAPRAQASVAAAMRRRRLLLPPSSRRTTSLACWVLAL